MPIRMAAGCSLLDNRSVASVRSAQHAPAVAAVIASVAGALHRVVGGPLGGLARFKEMRIRWQPPPVGIPPVLFGAEDLVDADDDVVTVHPLASVDLENRRICHARRTAIS